MTPKQQEAWDAAIKALGVCAHEVINHPDGHTQQFANAQEMAEAAIWLLREAGDGWEPMETAPTDVLIDIWIKSGVRRTGYVKIGKYWVGPDGRLQGKPTHWRRPPAPPKETV